MEESKYHLLQFILKHRKINFISFIILFITIMIIVFFFIPKQYTSEISILPAAANFSQSLSSRLGGLGKLAGLDLGVNSGQSQEMFMAILKSERLLDKIIYQQFEFMNDNRLVKQNLIEFFEIKGESDRDSEEKVLKQMRGDVIWMMLDKDNDILSISITTENPNLSALIANRMIEVLNEIVKSEVQKEFYQKLGYLQKRINEIQDSLKIAETEYKNFLETNTDPSLPSFQIQQLRLRRNVEIQTQLYIEFRKQLEVYIADTMINLADIKVLDSAETPYRKSRPKRILIAITFVMLGAFIQLGTNSSIIIYKKVITQIREKILDS